MTLSDKKVLVTGAGGFIGSHLVERLVSLGAKTRAFVNYNSTGTRGWIEQIPAKKDVEIFVGDICDPELLEKAMKGVDMVFHLAALIAIPYSYESPLSYVRTNIEGTLNVLQTARHADVSLVIHTSTSEVYGTALYVPIDEKHPLQGQSPYSASKIGADKMVEAFHLSFGLPVVTLRPFNTFGPRQSARAVIPSVISQCLNGCKVRIGNVLPTRDFNYVGNTVEGYVRAAMSPKAIGKTINLGSGVEISIGDLLQMIGRMTGQKIDIEHEKDRFRPVGSEVNRLLANNALAKQILGWEPSVQLEDGLKMTIEWMRSNLGRYRPEIYAV